MCSSFFVHGRYGTDMVYVNICTVYSYINYLIYKYNILFLLIFLASIMSSFLRPFTAAEPMNVFRQIKQGIQAVAFPKSPKGPWSDFVKGLCHEDVAEQFGLAIECRNCFVLFFPQEPSERLPMRKGGARNVEVRIS